MDKKIYKDVIGVPSGEVLSLPSGIIRILMNKGLIEINFIENKRYYIFDDDNLEDIIEKLTKISEELW